MLFQFDSKVGFHNIKMIKIIVALFLLTVVMTIKMQLTLGPQEQRCFYQMLMTQQKYAVEVYPLFQGRYEIAVKHQEDNTWLHSVKRTIKQPLKNITLYKLASSEALYSFCLTNIGLDQLKLRVSIRWGLQLLDLQVLAQQNDQQQIKEQAKWIQKQTDKILQLVNSANIRRVNRQQLNQLMGTKLLLFACLGLVSLTVISLYFYGSVKKSFRERKLI